MMIKVEAIVREEKFEDVKAALNEIEVNGITVSQVMGCGAQRGYKEIVRGSEIEIFMQPKIKFEIVVSSEEWEKKTIEAIQKAAYTGEVGDGKIFSYEIRSAMKIRTVRQDMMHSSQKNRYFSRKKVPECRKNSGTFFRFKIEVLLLSLSMPPSSALLCTWDTAVLRQHLLSVRLSHTHCQHLSPVSQTVMWLIPL